jgi:CRP-like cAMP-binding protein
VFLKDASIMKHFSLKCYYQKDMVICQEYDPCKRIGLLVTGELELIHYTYNGEKRSLARLTKGDLFGDFLINSIFPFYPGDLIAKKDCEIAFLDKKSLNELLKSNDVFRHYFLSQLSDKALQLNHHNKILLQSSLREKINMWLSYETVRHQSNRITISSKESLANYLNVTRPSLSRELMHMKAEGLIDYTRNYIDILT